MITRLLVLVVSVIFLLPQAASAYPEARFKELKRPVTVIRDRDGIPHIYASNEHDLFLMQGYVHARDRFFQMDVLRHQAGGTLAELFGESVLADDVELRTIGLRRAAKLSVGVVSANMRGILEAYAEGVNLFLDRHDLPPEYAALELTEVEPWTALDSLTIAKLLSFGLSFDLEDIRRTEVLMAYMEAGGASGFDGWALFFEDLFRAAPFEPVATVPEAEKKPPAGGPHHHKYRRKGHGAAYGLKPETLSMAKTYMARVKSIPFFHRALNRSDTARGSNEWAVSGRYTANGRPLLANDPHLALVTPATFYQNHLVCRRTGYDAVGSSFPGVPLVVLGQNRYCTWGSTFNPLDVTDVYQEDIVADLESPSGLSTVYLGENEPIVPLPESFYANSIGDGVPDNVDLIPPSIEDGIPAATLIVPRRNQGPIIRMINESTALSLQYAGFSGTRDLEAFYEFNKARSLADFKAGLQKFDVGSQNFAYADVFGNIAYFTSAEIPVREDLQNGTVNGLPPFFIRSGQGGNEWLEVQNPQPFQALPYEILPFKEMPQIVNPPAGYFYNANNDPIGNTLDNDVLNQLRPGGGIFYLNPGYAIGTRAGRIGKLLGDAVSRGSMTLDDMQDIQADVVMRDAEVFTPYILRAFRRAKKNKAPALLKDLGKDPRIKEAVNRLTYWDYSTPTGVPEGYDAWQSDDGSSNSYLKGSQASVNATIYSVWRAVFIKNTIDRTLEANYLGEYVPDSGNSLKALRHLLEKFKQNKGVGASGLDFFEVDGIGKPSMRRDIIILQSLQEALDNLAGPQFMEAFNGSTYQEDYLWGRLHRIVFEHPLGWPFSIPPAGGAFPPTFVDLDGIATDGGFGVVDASSHNARAMSSNGYMFDAGPVRRYAGQIRRWPLPIDAETILPGGSSGVLGSPHYTDLLGRWLANETYPVRQSLLDVFRSAERFELYLPKKGRRWK